MQPEKSPTIPSSRLQRRLTFDVFAFAVIGTMGYSSYLALPILLGALGDIFKLSETATGGIGSAEMVGLLIGSLSAARLLNRFPAVTLAIAGLLIAVTGNLATAFVTGIGGLLATRVVAGFGGGLCYALATSHLATAEEPTRNFSLLTVLMVLQTSVLLIAMPAALPHGLLAMLMVIVISLAVALVLCPFLTRAGSSSSTDSAIFIPGAPALLMAGRFALAATVLFGVTTGGVWALVERIGAQSRLSPTDIGNALSYANLTGIVTCWFAARADRWFRAKWLTLLSVGLTALVLATWSVGTETYEGYSVRCLIMFQSATFALVYIMAIFGCTDSSGKQAALIPAALGVGLAIGPWLTALVAEQSGYRVALIWQAVVLLFVMALLLCAYARIDAVKRAEIAVSDNPT